MRTLHEAALGVLRRPGGHGRDPSRAGPALTAGARPAPGGGRAGRAETVRFAAARALPLIGRGGGVPRPAFSADALRSLRARHGGAPVLVRGPAGTVLVLLDPRELRQFYEESAEPAEPALPALRALSALPAPPADGGPAPAGCGAFEDAVRAWHPPDAFHSALTAEARRLASGAGLDLARLREAVARAARRIDPGGFGAGAGAAGDLLDPPGPLRRRGRARAAPADAHALTARAARRFAAAGAAGLAGPAGPGRPDTAAHPWPRALDGIPATLLRTLLLLAGHPAEQDAAAAEAAAGGAPGELPRLRACVQETLRLYPAVPDLIRVTRTETEWRGVRHPAGTAVLLPAHFHQRDPEHVPAAHVFVPGRWKSPGADRDLRMAPFGHGTGRCPGDRLGLLVTTVLCAEVLRRTRVTAVRPVLDPTRPLPTALDPRGIRLGLTRR